MQGRRFEGIAWSPGCEMSEAPALLGRIMPVYFDAL